VSNRNIIARTFESSLQQICGFAFGLIRTHIRPIADKGLPGVSG